MLSTRSVLATEWGLSALRRYSWRAFAADVTAGAAVSLLALPLAMGFAIASNVSPQAGLVCAIAGGLAIALLGGSRVQIGGPTAAFVLLTSGIVTRYGLDGLFICTIMAGVMLIALGATGMGPAVKYVPRPIVVGFTNGISLLLVLTQVKDALGLTMAQGQGQAQALQVPADVVGRATAIALAIGTVHWPAAILTAACLAAIIVSARRDMRVTGSIAAVGAGTLLTMMFGIPVETIASRFQGATGALSGALPGAWPVFHLPPPRWDLAWTLLPAAFAVAVLVAIESVMSAVEADHLGGDRHDANRELVAHGVANLASPLFGGLPASSTIVRTGANVRAGARTPVAGIVHALALLLIAVAFAPLASAIPLPVLAALLLSVAWTIGGWQELPSVLRASRADAIAWLITLLLVVFADLTQAVPAAMALAGLLFIRTIASGTTGARVVQDLAEPGLDDAAIDRASADGLTPGEEIPPYAAAFRLVGSFLFAGADILATIVDRLDSLPPIVILRLDEVPAADATSLRAIEALADRIRASGRVLLVCGAQAQPSAVMRRTRFHDRLGPDNVCPAWRDARARAKALFEERFQPGFPYGAVATAAAH